MLEGVLFSPSVTEPVFMAIELERMKVVSVDYVRGLRYLYHDAGMCKYVFIEK